MFNRSLFFAGSILLIGLAHGQVATTITSANGSIFTVNGASYTGAATGIQHLANFRPSNDTRDYDFRYSFLYRQTGDTREYSVTNSAATFANTADTFTATVDRNVNNTGANTLRFTILHKIMNNDAVNPILVTTITALNISETARSVTMFHYSDFDIPSETATGGANDQIGAHSVHANGIKTRLQDSVTTTNFAETYAVGATRYQSGPLYSTQWTNTTIENLNNTAPFTVQDSGMGFQWDDVQLAAGQSTSYTVYTSLNSPVPEPATLLTLGTGALLALRRKRSKS